MLRQIQLQAGHQEKHSNEKKEWPKGDRTWIQRDSRRIQQRTMKTKELKYCGVVTGDTETRSWSAVGVNLTWSTWPVLPGSQSCWSILVPADTTRPPFYTL
ncbi:hypothetical protein CRENBAI_025908 [Crenichthys baileyi]|uniref:Uncharacterized protein n=1 Tax=Crenichthys baileyi TaxID=28760 RepID=A0AAV9S5Z0_9TELE